MYNAQQNNGNGHSDRGASVGPGTSEAVEDEGTIYIGDLLRVIWRRLWVIVLVAFVFAASAVGLGLLQTPVYEASIKMVVGQEQTYGPVNIGNDVEGLQKFAQTVTELVATRPMAEEVVQQLNLQTTPEEFLENVEVEPVGETQVVEVSYRDTDPARAQEVVDTIGDVFSEQVSEVSPNANAMTATVWERATTPASPASPNLWLNGLLALLLGGALGLGLAFLLERLDDRWRSPEELEQASGVPTFGAIRAFKVPKVETGAKKELTSARREEG